MQFGDIFLVEIPVSGGHEQAGIRPAIIAQTSDLEKAPTILIVPLTSMLKASDFPFTFVIKPDQLNNLDTVSIALVFQLRAIDKRRLKNKMGKINNSDVILLKQQLKNIMGL